MKVRVPVTLAAVMATVLTVGLTACTGTASESSSGNSLTVPLLKVGLPWSQPAGGLNIANYDPPSVDSLLAAGVATAFPAGGLDIYGQIIKDVAADVPYVPLYQSNAYLALSGKFTLPALGNDSFETPWALNVKPAA